MKTVIYIICACVFLGGLGMSVANRKVDRETARDRWVKYFSYLVIMATVFTSIIFNVFGFVGMAIVAVGYFELTKALNDQKEAPLLFQVITILVYSFIGICFLIFAFLAGPNLWIYIYLQVIVFDAFCQVTGQLFGKKKLVPNISPSKTLEGLIGGSVFCIWIAMLTAGLVHSSVAKGAIWGVITCISSLSGDLLASWFKRKMAIKDFSKLLPGQGGILDRFDSLVMTMAIYWMMVMAGLFTIIFEQ